jgi:D-3-phosphoglycerate dehydrogenase / 2-oxoglutarate reductase
MAVEQRVLVTDAGELLAPGVERLREAGVDVEVLPEATLPLQAASRAADVPVVIVGVMRIDGTAISVLRATRLLIRAGIGYDVIDVAAATRRGIWVANVPDYCVDEVADHTTLLVLAAMRRLPEMTALWRTEDKFTVNDLLPPVHRPRGLRLGIIGFGRIGRAVAARAQAFGWQVVAHDPLVAGDDIRANGASPVAFSELLETSDAITLHAPLQQTTTHLIGTAELAAMKRGVVIVNTSRGGLVDLDALDTSVVDGHVAAVGLDVLDGEPNPDLSHPLLSRPNVVVTPHVAWYSIEARRELALRTADEALRYLRGQRPRNIVNPEAEAEAEADAVRA